MTDNNTNSGSTKNIFKIPIRIRQAPPFALQALERAIVSKYKPRPEVTFHLCFFTCRSYFKYLYCSLHSLFSLKGHPKFRIYIFSDENDPLSAEQISCLKSLEPNLSVRVWPRSQGWGAEQIGSIWRAYELVAADSSPNDYIVRVDSDVFFFSDWLFHLVAKSDKDLVGDGHFVNLEYSQGGLYFIRAGTVSKVVSLLQEHPLHGVLTEAGIGVEDRAAYYLVNLVGGSRWLLWFMMFPDEYRIAGGLNRYNRWKFCCIHFVMRNKDKMLEAYFKELLDPAEQIQFSKVLRVS